jgi:hexosaminidase
MVRLLQVLLFQHLLRGVASTPLPLWPMPKYVTQAGAGGVVLASNWRCAVDIPGYSSEILQKACVRYKEYIAQARDLVVEQFPLATTVNSVQVAVDQAENDTMLGLETNETYALLVDNESIRIHAANVFGALRALETFSQIVTSQMSVLAVTIQDTPRFPHRELLVDTARYFFNTSFLEHIIDSMSFSKLNVLHWHAIDSQSFPIDSTKYPLLSEKGQFKPHSHFCASSSCSYTSEDIQQLIAYARDRGIRIVLEVDTPGHSKSWGNAYHNMTVNYCTLNADSVPLDVTKAFTLDVVTGFLLEMTGKADNSLFTDKWTHLGGDEVDFSCWEKDEAIASYMAQHNLTAGALLSQWLQQVRSRLQVKNVLYWEDAYNYSVAANGSEGTIFQVWRDSNTLQSIAAEGSQCTLHAGWYIHAKSKWTDFYDNEPYAGTWRGGDKKNVKGGGVSFWGCSGFCPFPFTAEAFDPRTWPVAAAAAERLWSPEHVADHASAMPRLTAHRERLLMRGVRCSALR